VIPCRFAPMLAAGVALLLRSVPSAGAGQSACNRILARMAFGSPFRFLHSLK
jgi:hypothetical protein